MSFLTPFLSSLLAALFSALSAMGVGGGSLQLIYLTELAGMEIREARAVNLLCFLLSALAALPIYRKKELLAPRPTLSLLLPGVLFALIGVGAARALPSGLLRRLFGGFLTAVSLRTLLARTHRTDSRRRRRKRAKHLE